MLKIKRSDPFASDKDKVNKLKDKIINKIIRDKGLSNHQKTTIGNKTILEPRFKDKKIEDVLNGN